MAKTKETRGETVNEAGTTDAATSTDQAAENETLKQQLADATARAEAAERDRDALREDLKQSAKLPPAGQTVDERPKHVEPSQEVLANSQAALKRLGRDPDEKMSDQERVELASLHVAYPEGAMFLRAVGAAVKVRRDREKQALKKQLP